MRGPGVASVPGMISLSKKLGSITYERGHGCKFEPAPPPVSMSGGCNDCDRCIVGPTPASASHMKTKDVWCWHPTAHRDLCVVVGAETSPKIDNSRVSKKSVGESRTGWERSI